MPSVNVYCPNGHMYDSSTFSSCPFCTPNVNQNIGKTNPVYSPQGNVGPTTPVNQNIPPTTPLTNPFQNNPMGTPTEYAGDLQPQTSKSINGGTPAKERVRPVVGWLVCVQGPDIGKDFRLHTHFNRVGRLDNQDVCLSDPRVSREHFTVSYDLMNSQYYAEMQSGGNTMVYINGQPLGGRIMLKKGDQIKVGDSMLVFIPLEEQDVKWNWKI